MSKGKYNLIITAHPDDETIFFGALVLSRRQVPWKIVCVTDGNADGQGAIRKKQFEKACRLLGVRENQWLGFPDVYEKRLDIEKLSSHLRSFSTPYEVFTHGILGEYGHPHHQDVSYAVHNAFQKHPRLYSTGWNCFPDLIVKMKETDYQKKVRILTEVYGSETRRFIHMLPGTAVESFTKISYNEVKALYDYFRGGKKPSARVLPHYRWLLPQLAEQGPEALPRPF